MRRLRNTLYVTTEGAWLHKDGENLVMEVEGEVRARLPVHDDRPVLPHARDRPDQANDTYAHRSGLRARRHQGNRAGQA